MCPNYDRHPTSCAVGAFFSVFVLTCPLPTAVAQDRQSPQNAPSAKYAADIRAFINELDRTYPFFDLKGIRKDWQRTKAEALRRAATCRAQTEFFRIVIDITTCLRDAHVGLRNVSAEMPPQPPARLFAPIWFWGDTSILSPWTKQ